MGLRTGLPRAALAAVVAILSLSFAAIEWAADVAFATGISTWGVALGIALANLSLLGIAGAAQARGAPAQALWAALATSAEMALGASFLFVLVMAASFLPMSLSERFLLGDRATDTIIYLALGLGMLLAVKTSLGALVQRKLDQAQARADMAERDRMLLQAEMALLRAQVEPHFLWNTLAHVQYLTRKNPEDAAVMTANLITYLRSTLPGMRRDASTLGSELASVRAYLDIMHIRMGQRLHTEVDVPEALAALAFPPLIVQTLVENAIKHGVEPKLGAVSVTVSARLEQAAGKSRLVLEVSDTGVGLEAARATAGTGLGLLSVRERLHGLYGERAAFSIADRAGGGVQASVSIIQ